MVMRKEFVGTAFLVALLTSWTTPASAQWVRLSSPRDWQIFGPEDQPRALVVSLGQLITVEGQAWAPAGIVSILVGGAKADSMAPDSARAGVITFRTNYTFNSVANELVITVRDQLGNAFSQTYTLAFRDADDLFRYGGKAWQQPDSLVLFMGTPDTVTIRLDDPTKLRVNPKYLTFVTGNAAVVTVDSAGVVTPVSPGSTEIFASGFDQTVHPVARVYDQPWDVAFSPADSIIELTVGQTLSVRAQVWQAAGEFFRGLPPKTSGADSIVLRPQGPGDFLAVRPGTANLLASLAGRTKRWLVRVLPPGLRIENEYRALPIGESRALAALRIDLAGEVLGPARGVLWSAADSAAASVHHDTVTGHAVGRLKLQGALGAASDTTTLFVLGDLLLGAEDPRGRPMIATLSIATAEVHWIGADSVEGSSPSLSPDGQLIAFSSKRETRQHRIYLMDADGRQVRRLLPDAPAAFGIRMSSYEERAPRWLASGDRIVFVSNRDGNYDIYSVKINGTGLLRLSNNGNVDWRVTTAPDIDRIAFERTVAAGDGDIIVANADGSGQKIFTTTPTALPAQRVSEGKPAFLPGGVQLLYARGAPRLDPAAGETLSIFDLTTGTSVRDLVPPLKDHELVFCVSPDGQRIAYHQRATWGKKNGQITIIDLDGNILATITVQGVRDILDLTWGAHSPS